MMKMRRFTRRGARAAVDGRCSSTRPHTPAFQPAVNRNPGKTAGSTGMPLHPGKTVIVGPYRPLLRQNFKRPARR